MTQKTPKETIKTILRGRLTLPEQALVEAYLNQEIAEFNKAARERNTLLAEVRDLQSKVADKERSVENLKAWLKESYKVNEAKREEITTLEESNKQLNTKVERLERGRALVSRVTVAEVARKEAVIQDLFTKLSDFRIAASALRQENEELNARVRDFQGAVDLLQKDVRKWATIASESKKNAQAGVTQLEREVANFKVSYQNLQELLEKVTDERNRLLSSPKRGGQTEQELAERIITLRKRNFALQTQVGKLTADQAHDHQVTSDLYKEISELYTRLGEKN